MKLYVFQTVFLSIIRSFHYTHSNGISHTGFLTACEQEQMLLLASCQQTCMTCTIAVCTVKNSWWWTEELSETCRFSFQNKFEKLVHVVGLIIRNLSHCMVTWMSKTLCCFEMSDTICPVTQWRIPQEQRPQQQCSKSLKTSYKDCVLSV